MNFIFLFFIITISFGRVTAVAATADRVLITGSSTIAPLMSEISKRFELKNKNIQINVQTGGSSKGIIDQRRKLSDLGMVSRSLRSSEKDLSSFLLAKDGVGFIAHKSNRVKNLTKKQAVDIYTGRIKNWKELGGEDKEIHVVNKAEGRSTLEVFLGFLKIKNSQIKADIIIGDNEQGIKTIMHNPSAIGYVSIGAAEYNISQGVNIKTLALDGVAATTVNVRNGSFPMARELNLISYGESQQKVKDLIQFSKSQQVRDIIEKFYFIPPAP